MLTRTWLNEEIARLGSLEVIKDWVEDTDVWVRRLKHSVECLAAERGMSRLDALREISVRQVCWEVYVYESLVDLRAAIRA